MKRDDFRINGTTPYPGIESTEKLGFWDTGSDEYRLTGKLHKWDPLKIHEVKVDKMDKTKFLNPFSVFYDMWMTGSMIVGSITFQADIVIGDKFAYKQGDKWTINDAEKAIEVLLKEIEELKNK